MAGTDPLKGDGERVLVVDDEPDLANLVATALRHAGYETSSVGDGLTALDTIAAQRPDLVVLDVMLPDIEGFEVCRRLRESGDETPGIFLTARDTSADTVSGFAGGGDDYITKPFRLDELTARVAAVLRRTRFRAAPDTPVRTYADLSVDAERALVTKAGTSIELSPTEFHLLEYLLDNAERVVSKQQIVDAVWGWDFDGDPRVVETYISYLRKKVDVHGEPLIETVRGFGYVMRRSG